MDFCEAYSAQYSLLPLKIVHLLTEGDYHHEEREKEDHHANEVSVRIEWSQEANEELFHFKSINDLNGLVTDELHQPKPDLILSFLIDTISCLDD